jgi:hypothetical protein
VWVEAAEDSLKASGDIASHALVVEQVADMIEEMASMDPRMRTSCAANYDGIVKAALDDWIADSEDEDDVERHAAFDNASEG